MTPRAPIIPNEWPLAESAFMRAHNCDLPALSGDALDAERTLLTIAWATRVFGRRRDGVIVVHSGKSFIPMAESVWLRERLRRIAVERKRRTAA